MTAAVEGNARAPASRRRPHARATRATRTHAPASRAHTRAHPPERARVGNLVSNTPLPHHSTDP